MKTTKKLLDLGLRGLLPTVGLNSAFSLSPVFFVLLVALASLGVTSVFAEQGNENPGPQRVISLAPSVTEIVAAIGAREQLIAVTRYCDFPPEIIDLPRVGGFVDPDIEKMFSLRPSLLLGLSDHAKLKQ